MVVPVLLHMETRATTTWADQPGLAVLTIMLDHSVLKALTSPDQPTLHHQATLVHLWAAEAAPEVEAAAVHKAVPDQEEAEDNYLI